MTGSYNLVGTGGSGGITGGTDNNVVLTSLAYLDLGPLANNGGPTQTMALLPGSAAIGEGTTADYPGTTTPITDQRGQPLDSPAADIGAYQLNGSLVLSSATFLPGGGGSPPAFAQIVAFGDSLSDTGNYYDANGSPDYPYYDGRASNGPNWIDQLAALLGVADPGPSLSLIPDPGCASCTNYAFAGATAAPESDYVAGLVPGTPLGGGAFTASGIPDLAQQVQSYLDNSAGTASSDALYTIEIGANDLVDGQYDRIEQLGSREEPDPSALVGDINAAIVSLIGAGAKNLLVPNLPPMGDAPYELDLGPADAQAMNALCEEFNGDLANDLASLRECYAGEGVTISSFDAYSLGNAVFQDPEAYGFTNVAGIGIDSPPATGYFSWDGVHPTTQFDTLFADAAYSALAPDDSTGTLFVSGSIKGSEDTSYTIQIYTSPFAAPASLDVTTDDLGIADFSAFYSTPDFSAIYPTADPSGETLWATATDTSGNISQFAQDTIGTGTPAGDSGAAYRLVPDASAPDQEDLYWYGTSGSDHVEFSQPAAGTVQISAIELAGSTSSFTATITGVTGSVVVNEYDGYGDSDVVDASGLTTIPSMITVGNGNDTIIGGGGANTIMAGSGNDTIYGNGEDNSPNPSGVEDPSNTITVGSGDDVIYGNYGGTGPQGGNNTITAGNGSDTIYGNYGNGGGSGDGAEGKNDNVITVGNGNDIIYGNYGVVDGAEGGNNIITAGNGTDVIYGTGSGDDTQRKCGSNMITVGNGSDIIYGNLGPHDGVGGDGGEGGDNVIVTGSGQDTIYGNFGGDGGEGGYNLIVAGGGNDTIYAHCATYSSGVSGTTAGGMDLIVGGMGADTVYGWPSGYTIGSHTGDIFVAGTVSLDGAALAQVLEEWSSSDSYADRVAYLSGLTGGLNMGNFLSAATITPNSTLVDEIFANVDSDDNWYLVTSIDNLNNVYSNEITLLD